jgi:hypothetical protein
VKRGVIVGLALLAAGCSGSSQGAPAPSTPPPTTSVAPQPTVNPPDVACGRLTVTVLGVRGGYEQIVGTHAEWPSDRGQFVRVRIRATNLDGTFHTFHTQASPIVDASGEQTGPSLDAARIKRQNEDVTLGGENVYQFDIWYDLTPAAKPRTVLLHQDMTCVRPLALPALTANR